MSNLEGKRGFLYDVEKWFFWHGEGGWDCMDAPRRPWERHGASWRGGDARGGGECVCLCVRVPSAPLDWRQSFVVHGVCFFNKSSTSSSSTSSRAAFRRAARRRTPGNERLHLIRRKWKRNHAQKTPTGGRREAFVIQPASTVRLAGGEPLPSRPAAAAALLA